MTKVAADMAGYAYGGADMARSPVSLQELVELKQSAGFGEEDERYLENAASDPPVAWRPRRRLQPLDRICTSDCLIKRKGNSYDLHQDKSPRLPSFRDALAIQPDLLAFAGAAGS